jgi:hypothetical protein
MGDVADDGSRWTAALVLAELRRALSRPVIRAPSRLTLLLEPEEALPPPNLVRLTELHLGRDSLERRAPLILAKPNMSIREMCREQICSLQSRTSLYRQARRGGRIVAERLNADRVAPPAT